MTEDTRSGATPPLVSGADIRTFLIADVRGYTRYTHQHGDEAAAALASAFAGIVRATVSQFEGELLELRGDEALCVFRSPRQAIRAAVALQRRFHELGDDGTAFPLGVGIGIALGEAVPTEGGYRGEALNVAARLCSIARGGEVLASDTVAAVAGRVDGVRPAGRRVVRVKGIREPLQIVAIGPEVPYRRVTAKGRPRARWVAAASVLVALAVAVVGGVTLSRAGSHGAPAVPPLQVRSGFATIDPRTNRVDGFHRDIPLTGYPIIAVGAGHAWVLTDNVVRQVSLANGRTVSRIPFAGADWLTEGAGGLWVNENQDIPQNLLYRIDPASLQIQRRVVVSDASGWLTSDARGVWFCANGILTVVSRRGRTAGRYPVHCGDGIDGTDSLVAAYGALWVVSLQGVERIDPASGRIERTIPPFAPSRVCAGLGAIWVLTGAGVVEIDPATNRAVRHFPVPGGQSIAAAFGSIWVGVLDRVIRIDVTTRARTVIPTRAGPEQLVAGGGRIWISLLD